MLFVAAALIAGCGSGNSTSASSEGTKSAAAGTQTASTAASEGEQGASAGNRGSEATPASGPLSEEPKVVPPHGPAPDHLVIKDIIKGTGAEATLGDRVTVNYVGVLYDSGKEFDASWRHHQPFPFTLGQGQVIPGWEEGVKGMRVGGRRELIIPPALGYGSRGAGGAIPPNAPLVFVVDLLGV